MSGNGSDATPPNRDPAVLRKWLCTHCGGWENVCDADVLFYWEMLGPELQERYSKPKEPEPNIFGD